MLVKHYKNCISVLFETFLIFHFSAWGSERKISFALGGIEKIGEREKERGAGDDDSQHSSNTELNNVEQEERRGMTPLSI